MEKAATNYKKVSLGNVDEVTRVTLHDDLALTGSEISINVLPAGISVPFVHAHRENEEVYLILSGRGQFYLDGEELAVTAGDVVRVDPAARRCMRADADSALRFVCIQARAGSLNRFTQDDGIPAEGKPSWM